MLLFFYVFKQKEADDKNHPPLYKYYLFFINNYLFSITACAAASLACGTLNGEQDT